MENPVIEIIKFEQNDNYRALLKTDLTEVNNIKNIRSYAAKRRKIRLHDFRNDVYSAIQSEIQLSFNEIDCEIFSNDFITFIKDNEYDLTDLEYMYKRFLRISLQYYKSVHKYQKSFIEGVKLHSQSDIDKIEIMFCDEIKERVDIEQKRFPEEYKNKNKGKILNLVLKKFIRELNILDFNQMVTEITKELVNDLKNSFIEAHK